MPLPIILILFLIFGLMFPGFILLASIIFLILLPMLMLVHSISMLVVAPVSLWQTFTNKQVRRNHALEHATANVLEEKYDGVYVGGMAFKNGFQLYGHMPSGNQVLQAAHEGLQRLKNGETKLALHPRCGTSILMSQLLFAIVFLMVFLFLHHFSVLEIIALFLLSSLLSKPVGLLAQKYITTSVDVDEMQLIDVTVRPNGSLFFHTGRKQEIYHIPGMMPFRPLFEQFFRRF